METNSCPTVQKKDLCHRCRRINLNDLFVTKRPRERNVRSGGGIFVMDLKSTFADLNNSNCPMCRLFASKTYRNVDSNYLLPDERITCHINAHSGLKIIPELISAKAQKINPVSFLRGEQTLSHHRTWWNRDVEPVGFLSSICNFIVDEWKEGRRRHTKTKPLKVAVLSVVEKYADSSTLSLQYRYYDPNENSIKYKTGFLCLISPGRPELEINQIYREQYNVEFVKRCMALCLREHGDICNSRSSEVVPFFRVIDCHERKVVTAPQNCEYAALSYVWGTPALSQSNDPSGILNCSDLGDCPKVISDSLQVALDLNLKYLWVDKYCINQLDNEDKAVQIGQMDFIYSNAVVTIIAAAGEGPHHGLPGVAGNLRKAAPGLRLGAHLLTSTLLHAQEIVSKTKWATRGWTYQEGVLSRRRLVFTDYQVFWECNRKHYAEVVQNHYNQEFWTEASNRCIFNHKEPGTELTGFLYYIIEFLKRELTYRSDSLNALSGIFRAFGKNGLHHLMGIPICFPSCWGPGGYPWVISKSASQAFLIGLTWRNDSRLDRFPIFPSWSWAGWNGSLEYSFAVHWAEEGVGDHIWIETDRGELLSFPSQGGEVLENFVSQLSSELRYIHIEARTFTCSLRHYPPCEDSLGEKMPELYFQISANPTILLHDSCLKQERESDDPQTSLLWPQPMTGILIGDTSGKSLQVTALIVQELDGYYERVTCCTDFRYVIYMEYENQLSRIWDDNIRMPLFSKWIREDTVLRTIRLG